MEQQASGVRLRIEVDNEDTLRIAERAGEMEGRVRLAHATLVVGNGDDPSHRCLEQLRRP